MVVRCVPSKVRTITGCWRIQGGVYWVLAHSGGCILGVGAFRGVYTGCWRIQGVYTGCWRIQGVYTGCWRIQGGVYWVLAHSGGAGILGGAFRGVYTGCWRIQGSVYRVMAHSGCA